MLKQAQYNDYISSQLIRGTRDRDGRWFATDELFLASARFILLHEWGKQVWTASTLDHQSEILLTFDVEPAPKNEHCAPRMAERPLLIPG
jgi:hypothetical protein